MRLPYRVDEWDPAFFAYLSHLSATKPVILTGDLNVGHLDLDIHNPTAKHISKQAGLTPQERKSFGQGLLGDGKFTDAFRFLFPDAVGQFTYWSQRTFARPVNKGIRLDYFICSNAFFPEAAAAGGAGGGPEGAAPGAGERARASELARNITGGTEVTVATELDVELLDQRTAQRTEMDMKSVPVPGVVDCKILHDETVGCSDHCPVLLTVRVA